MSPTFHSTAPMHGKMVYIYVSIYLPMYQLPRICRTLVPEIHVRSDR